MGDVARIEEKSVEASNSAQKGLTCIPQRIHCPATQDTMEAGNDELDDINIEHFLDTLSEIALSIAARELSKKEEQGRDT